MHRLLVVANRTLGGTELLDRVRAAAEAGPLRVDVVVPVSPDAGREARDEAGRRLVAELDRLRALGAEADGEVVVSDAYRATVDALDTHGSDEVIVCTLPSGLSRWWRENLVTRVRAATTAPVTHIVAPAGLPTHVRTDAVRLTIFVGERDRAGHRPLASEILARARAAGLAGGTVLRGIEGFGASSVVHTARLLTMSEDLPIVVLIVDSAERVDAFLPVLDELVVEGLVVREPVEIVKYEGRRG